MSRANKLSLKQTPISRTLTNLVNGNGERIRIIFFYLSWIVPTNNLQMEEKELFESKVTAELKIFLVISYLEDRTNDVVKRKPPQIFPQRPLLFSLVY